MEGHDLIIGVVIVGIVILQILVFIRNKAKLKLLGNIFPSDNKAYELIKKDGDVLVVSSNHRNEIFTTIRNSLNDYLDKNRGGVSDFHLMKDIVDRNCDAIDEEIQVQIPVPLYMGLMGTMFGILFGVGFLVYNGGLNDLLSTDGGSGGSGAKGIEMLLGGVALAMFSSIAGILLTTIGSYIAKKAKSNVAKNKNTFLSWIQAELLPKISNDTSAALVAMTNNLTTFNSTFSGNTESLRETLENVNESYETQVNLIASLNRLNLNEIATANIEVYENLKDCTDEIGVFAQYLQQSNEYLIAMQALSARLDEHEGRTQVIERAGEFYRKNEKWLADNIDSANLEMRGAIDRFNNDTEKCFNSIKESINEQTLGLNEVIETMQSQLQESLKEMHEAFESAIIAQQASLEERLSETSPLIEELRNLTEIKESISTFEKATSEQNKKIDDLTKEIRNLAAARSDGGGGVYTNELELPQWAKIPIISGGGLIAVSCIVYIISSIHNFIYH